MNEKSMLTIGPTARICAVSAALAAAAVSDAGGLSQGRGPVRPLSSHQANDLSEAHDDGETVLDLGDFDSGSRVVDFDDVTLACCNAEPVKAGRHGS